MKVTIAQARSLFKSLGYDEDVVDEWTNDQLEKKLNSLPASLKGKTPKGDEAKAMKVILAKIVEAKDDDEEIEIGVEKGKPAAKVAAKPAPKKGGKKKVEEDEEEDDEDSDSDGDEDDDESGDEDDDESGDDDDDESGDDEDEGEEDSEDEEVDDDSESDDSDDDDSETEDEEDDEVEAKPAKGKGKGKGKPETKPKGEKNTDDDEDEKPAKKKFPKKGGGDGKPGVILSIVQFLAAASEQKPISKKTLHEKLKKRFPNRDKGSMWTTVNIQVPSRLKVDKDVVVKKNEKGYWCPPSKTIKALLAKFEKAEK